MGGSLLVLDGDDGMRCARTVTADVESGSFTVIASASNAEYGLPSISDLSSRTRPGGSRSGATRRMPVGEPVRPGLEVQVSGCRVISRFV